MSELVVKREEDIDITRTLTPPYSEHGHSDSRDPKENANKDDVKQEDIDTAIDTTAKDNKSEGIKPEDIRSEGIGSEDIGSKDLKPEDTTQVLPKKRGRPKSTSTASKESSKKPKTSEPTGAATLPDAKSKRGRQPGSTSADTTFTTEQEAYIRELFTSPQKLKVSDIHAKFEERFNTGRSSNTVRFRWYKLREEGIVLTGNEEAALRKAIETIETNKALAVLNEYTKSGEGFTKLSQGFVWKKIKEWGSGGQSDKAAKMKEEGTAEMKEEGHAED